MSNDADPGRDALVYEPSAVSWAVAELVARPPAALIRISLYLILLLIGGAAVFAHFATVSISVSGAGAVRTSAKILAIGTEVSGRVSELKVRTGQRVNKGDVLLELEDLIGPGKAQEAQGLIGRLDKLLLMKTSSAAKSESQTLAQVPLRLNLSVLVKERSSLAEATNSLYQAQHELLETLPALSRADKSERSLAKGKISKIRKAGLGGELRSELNELQQQVGRLSVSIRDRREQANRKVSMARTALEIQVRSFEQALAAHMKSQRILAPASGTISQVAVAGTGEILTPGKTLLELIPEGSHLVAKVAIANRDIAQLRIGLPVELKIDALPYQDYGVVAGRVVEIPPDAVKDEKGGTPFYEVIVSIDQTELNAGQGPRSVILGMSLVADFHLRRRTLLQLALKEILKLGDIM